MSHPSQERAKVGKCAKLLCTLYGLRTAGSWEREYTCLEVHILPPREDDQERRTRRTKGVLPNKYLVKVRSILGPEGQDDAQLVSLQEIVPVSPGSPRYADGTASPDRRGDERVSRDLR